MKYAQSATQPCIAPKTYSLHFHENERGVAKRLELECWSLDEVLKILQSDDAKREVEVYEGGKYRARILHTSYSLEVSFAR